MTIQSFEKRSATRNEMDCNGFIQKVLIYDPLQAIRIGGFPANIPTRIDGKWFLPATEEMQVELERKWKEREMTR